ncbi:MAG: class I SAM-dependent methyltransferase [Acidobacteriia bacterium]|nr:class I SAM-dependent methyltransferase [Terriglobia bacterium]
MNTPASVYEYKAFKYSSHDWILKLVPSENKRLRILDVGTAGGYLGKALRARGHSVSGIENDAARAEQAKGYYDSLQVADLETYDFPYRDEFDYILFADVLEHLRDPAAVLRRCLPALKNSGKLIISVPNVANVVIRLSLLFGRFDYMDRGILDRTHLRFFTRRSLIAMLREASCEVGGLVATPLPWQLVLPFTGQKVFAPLHEALYLLTRCWKAGLGYQFVITAAPNHPELSGGSTHNHALNA